MTVLTMTVVVVQRRAIIRPIIDVANDVTWQAKAVTVTSWFNRLVMWWWRGGDGRGWPTLPTGNWPGGYAIPGVMTMTYTVNDDICGGPGISTTEDIKWNRWHWRPTEEPTGIIVETWRWLQWQYCLKFSGDLAWLLWLLIFWAYLVAVITGEWRYCWGSQ